MWDILKQEKDQYVSLIKDITYINEASDELSLHHDYSINSRLVQQLTDYINEIGNPDMSVDKMINIVTQEEISPFDTEYLLNCLYFGEKLLQDFNHERLLIRLQEETLYYSLMILIYLFLVKLKLRLMKMPRLSLMVFMNICLVISCTLTLLNLFTCIFDLTLIKTTDRPVQDVELKKILSWEILP